MNCEFLENAVRNGIPISAQMDFRVRELSAQSIVVSGGADENLNVHNTAFAGSLYSICTLAAWGLTFSKLPGNCSLVMAKAEIEYLRPVQGEIVASAMISEAQSATFLATLTDTGKARLSVEVIVENQQKTAVKFIAHLHVKA
ncbi:MAG: YiiD C-terminal domain-containing protein [Oceanospirillaceae bacterium]